MSTKKERLNEIKELEGYIVDLGRKCSAIQGRIDWLKENLESIPSNEETTMEREYSEYMSSKTQSFTL